jgi:hypothetical protein
MPYAGMLESLMISTRGEIAQDLLIAVGLISVVLLGLVFAAIKMPVPTGSFTISHGLSRSQAFGGTSRTHLGIISVTWNGLGFRELLR